MNFTSVSDRLRLLDRICTLLGVKPFQTADDSGRWTGIGSPDNAPAPMAWVFAQHGFDFLRRGDHTSLVRQDMIDAYSDVVDAAEGCIFALAEAGHAPSRAYINGPFNDKTSSNSLRYPALRKAFVAHAAAALNAAVVASSGSDWVSVGSDLEVLQGPRLAGADEVVLRVRGVSSGQSKDYTAGTLSYRSWDNLMTQLALTPAVKPFDIKDPDVREELANRLGFYKRVPGSVWWFSPDDQVHIWVGKRCFDNEIFYYDDTNGINLAVDQFADCTSIEEVHMRLNSLLDTFSPLHLATRRRLQDECKARNVFCHIASARLTKDSSYVFRVGDTMYSANDLRDVSSWAQLCELVFPVAVAAKAAPDPHQVQAKAEQARAAATTFDVGSLENRIALAERMGLTKEWRTADGRLSSLSNEADPTSGEHARVFLPTGHADAWLVHYSQTPWSLGAFTHCTSIDDVLRTIGYEAPAQPQVTTQPQAMAQPQPAAQEQPMFDVTTRDGRIAVFRELCQALGVTTPRVADNAKEACVPARHKSGKLMQITFDGGDAFVVDNFGTPIELTGKTADEVAAHILQKLNLTRDDFFSYERRSDRVRVLRWLRNFVGSNRTDEPDGWAPIQDGRFLLNLNTHVHAPTPDGYALSSKVEEYADCATPEDAAKRIITKSLLLPNPVKIDDQNTRIALAAYLSGTWPDTNNDWFAYDGVEYRVGPPPSVDDYVVIRENGDDQPQVWASDLRGARHEADLMTLLNAIINRDPDLGLTVRSLQGLRTLSAALPTAAITYDGKVGRPESHPRILYKGLSMSCQPLYDMTIPDAIEYVKAHADALQAPAPKAATPTLAVDTYAAAEKSLDEIWREAEKNARPSADPEVVALWEKTFDEIFHGAEKREIDPEDLDDLLTGLVQKVVDSGVSPDKAWELLKASRADTPVSTKTRMPTSKLAALPVGAIIEYLWKGKTCSATKTHENLWTWHTGSVTGNQALAGTISPDEVWVSMPPKPAPTPPKQADATPKMAQKMQAPEPVAISLNVYTDPGGDFEPYVKPAKAKPSLFGDMGKALKHGAELQAAQRFMDIFERVIRNRAPGMMSDPRAAKALRAMAPMLVLLARDQGWLEALPGGEALVRPAQVAMEAEAMQLWGTIADMVMPLLTDLAPALDMLDDAPAAQAAAPELQPERMPELEMA